MSAFDDVVMHGYTILSPEIVRERHDCAEVLDFLHLDRNQRHGVILATRCGQFRTSFFVDVEIIDNQFIADLTGGGTDGSSPMFRTDSPEFPGWPDDFHNVMAAIWQVTS